MIREFSPSWDVSRGVSIDRHTSRSSEYALRIKINRPWIESDRRGIDVDAHRFVRRSDDVGRSRVSLDVDSAIPTKLTNARVTKPKRMNNLTL